MMNNEAAFSHISGRKLRQERLFKKAGAYILILLVSSFLLLYVWQRVQVIAVGSEVLQLKKTRDELLRENKNLRIETATLTSPDRIEIMAGKYIGMRPPEDVQLVLVKRLDRQRKNIPGPRKAEAAGVARGRS